MRIGIIGAGAIGLTAAYRLSAQGHEVTILEKRPDLGGLTGTLTLGEEPIEKIYHHIFTSDTHVLSLMEELGLEKDMVWNTPKSGIYIHGQLYPFSSPLDLLRFPELPFFQRIAMGLLVIRARFVKDWKRMENLSARDWIVRHAGKQVYDKIWGPLIRSKFDKDADQISAVWIWNKFKLRGSTRGKDVSSEAFGYLDGSFGRLYQALSDKVKDKGGKILFDAQVHAIERNKDGTLTLQIRHTANASQNCLENVSTGDDQKCGRNLTRGVDQTIERDFTQGVEQKGERYFTQDFDQILMTGSPDAFADMTGDALEETYRKQCRAMRYKANLCMLLELDAPLSPYYWITVAEETSPFVLVIEHTNLIRNKPYGSHVVYLSRYLDVSDPLFSQSDEVIEKAFLDALSGIFPAFSRSSVKGVHLFRERDSQPVVGMEYDRLRPAVRTPIDNLFLASMAQIYPEDRGQNYSIRFGNELADIMGKAGNP